MTTLRQAAQQALEALECMIDDLMYKDHKRVIDISNVAITALRTALEQPEQQAEPVCPECKAALLYECIGCSSNNYPPQRQWQGLTDEDWEHIDNKKGTALDTFAQGAVWAADQLKERNT